MPLAEKSQEWWLGVDEFDAQNSWRSTCGQTLRPRNSPAAGQVME
jgi:hypothetical protein